MEVEIDLGKSAQANANDFFEKSKKARKKLAGVLKAIPETKKRMEKSAKSDGLTPVALVKKRRREWFEQFHWFKSSDGLLVIAGRDAKSNELLVKRYMEAGDVYFHAEIQGAAHCVVKAKDNKAPKKTLSEAAEFAAANSKAWQEGLASVDVYSVKPGQVSKSAPSGEALGSGAFMIYGERQWFKKTPVNFWIGLKKEGDCFVVVSGPESAVKKVSFASFKVVQGKDKKGEAAKKLKALFEGRAGKKLSVSLDEFVAMLPPGNVKVLEP